jgi:hypothetical protein
MRGCPVNNEIYFAGRLADKELGRRIGEFKHHYKDRRGA